MHALLDSGRGVHLVWTLVRKGRMRVSATTRTRRLLAMDGTGPTAQEAGAVCGQQGRARGSGREQAFGEKKQIRPWSCVWKEQ